MRRGTHYTDNNYQQNPRGRDPSVIAPDYPYANNTSNSGHRQQLLGQQQQQQQRAYNGFSNNNNANDNWSCPAQHEETRQGPRSHGHYQGGGERRFQHSSSSSDSHNDSSPSQYQQQQQWHQSATPWEVEITPGVFAPVHGAEETWAAVKDGYADQSACMSCGLQLLHISDASYIMCPSCKVVSSSGHPNGGGGGVGLGLRADYNGHQKQDKTMPVPPAAEHLQPLPKSTGTNTTGSRHSLKPSITDVLDGRRSSNSFQNTTSATLPSSPKAPAKKPSGFQHPAANEHGQKNPQPSEKYYKMVNVSMTLEDGTKQEIVEKREMYPDGTYKTVSKTIISSVKPAPVYQTITRRKKLPDGSVQEIVEKREKLSDGSFKVVSKSTTTRRPGPAQPAAGQTGYDGPDYAAGHQNYTNGVPAGPQEVGSPYLSNQYSPSPHPLTQGVQPGGYGQAQQPQQQQVNKNKVAAGKIALVGAQLFGAALGAALDG